MAENKDKDLKKNDANQEELKLDPLAEMKAQIQEELRAEMKKILEDANKEAAEIIANAKAQAEAKVVVVGNRPKELTEKEKYMNEEVEIELFEDNGKYKDDVTVAVNGKLWVIQRGVPVKVPRFVKAVIDNSMKQDRAASQYSKARQAEYEATLK